MLEEKGTLFKICPTERGANWSKTTFVIDIDDPKYPKKLAIDAWNDKGELVENIAIGSNIIVGYDISSKEYNGKWYTNARMIFIKENGVASQTVKQVTEKYSSNSMSSDDFDDLPF